MKRLTLIFFLFLSCLSLKAQFSLTGSDPGSVRWMKMDTPNFRIIFPVGEDSLAKVYGSWLEKTRTAVSWSSGMKIGEYYKSRMPVVLHSFYPVANASVTWAPKRMDIYTNLDPYAPTPIRWEKMLAIHEGRHASQMQAGAGGRNRIFSILTGEIFAGAAAGLYAGPTLLEGDAVVTETSMTQSGRGRQGSFLTYMAPAFDSGDWRDFWKWSLGSNKFYTPDHYRAGYMLVSGMRVFFSDPLFTEEYFSKVRKGGFFLLRKTVKDASGMNIKKSFRAIEEQYHDIWSKEAALREPFMPSVQISGKPWRHVEYSGSVIDNNGNLWSKKNGMTVTGSLVSISNDGQEKRARSFASYTSPLAYDKVGERIWWSEIARDPRWSLAGDSRIRYVETSNPSKVRDLTKKGKYFNPAPSPDGNLVSVVEYPPSGGSKIVLLRSSDGSKEREIQAPDSLQFTETAWCGDKLFAAGLSDNGMGIYEVTSGINLLLGPKPVELSILRGSASGITFLCDRTGVNELYLLETGSGVLKQVTSTRYGISSPAFNDSCDTLYFSTIAPSDAPEAHRDGWMIHATPAKDLPMKTVSFEDIHKYPVADALSAQEKKLAGDAWDEFTTYSETEFKEPVRYRKLTPVFHSWAPIFFDYDEIEGISSDEYYKTASLGATAVFQNLVGDGYGTVGYGLHTDPDLTEKWRHSAHIRYTYSGLYPVFELYADFGDRSAKDVVRVQEVDFEKKKESVFTEGIRRDAPYFDGHLRVYIPLNFSSGGVSRGLIPQVKFRMTNDLYNDKILLREKKGEDDTPEVIGTLGTDHLSPIGTVDYSIRGYVVRQTAPSLDYPRLGIGAEIGLRTKPGHRASFGNTAYLYTYGYLPGLLANQGLRITATLGKELGGMDYSYPETPISFLPRGFAETNIRSISNSCSPEKMKFSLDYSIPLLNLDWSWLSPLVYVKNLSITPFFDLAHYKFKQNNEFHINKNGIESETLWSGGVDLVFNLGNILWFPFDSKFGFRYARNHWNNIGRMNIKNLEENHFEVLFSTSL